MCKCTHGIEIARKFRCGECGSRNVHLKNVKGRSFPYKTFSNLKIEVDLDLHVCDDCDNYILSGSDATNLDAACERSLTILKSYLLKKLKWVI